MARPAFIDDAAFAQLLANGHCTAGGDDIDPNAFRAKYVNAGGDIPGLRQRLATFCKRTLRKQVLEYVRYTQRRAVTQPFCPTDAEQALYDAISKFLQREDSYAIPTRQRHLTVLILRKLLASSSHAIADTLATLQQRLVDLRDGAEPDDNWTDDIITAEEIEEELLDEWLAAHIIDLQRRGPSACELEIIRARSTQRTCVAGRTVPGCSRCGEACPL